MFLDWAHEHGGFKSVSFDRDIFPSIENREIWDNLPKEIKEEIVLDAEKHLGYSWPAPKATDWMEFKRTGDRLAQENYFFERRNILNTLALAECIENKGRFLDDIINGVYSTCEETFWGLSAHMGGNYESRENIMVAVNIDPYIDIFAGCTAADLTMVMNLVGEKIKEIAPQINDRVANEMKLRILNPLLYHFDYEWMGLQNGRVNNWDPWICSNVITVLLKYCEDMTLFKNCLGKLFVAGEMYLRNYMPDGGCDEGPMYWGKSGGAFFEFIEQLYRSTDGGINLFDYPIVKNMGRYISRVNIKDKYFVNFADGHAILGLNPYLLYSFGKYTNNKDLQSMGKLALDSAMCTAKNPTVNRKSGELRTLVQMLASYQEIKSFDASGNYETDSYLPDLCIVTSREKADKSGLFFAAKGGHNDESGAHNHNDVAHYILYSSGTPLVVDPGTEVYSAKTFSSERYDIWTMRSDWHNTPTINNEKQFASAEAKAIDFTYQKQGNTVKTSCNAYLAYGEKANVSKFIRNIEFNQTEKSLQVTDEFTFTKNKGNTVTENIILAKKPEITDNEILLTAVSGETFSLEYSKNVKVDVDTQYTGDDGLMKRDWGENLYRLRLVAEDLGENAVISYKIIKE